MQHRIRGSSQPFVLFVIKSKPVRSEIAAKNVHACREVLPKSGEIEVQLQRAPQAPLRILLIFCANQKVQRFPVIFDETRRKVGPDVTRCASEKDRHVD